jgi:hypothetical protein
MGKGKKSAKTLLKLVVYTGGLKASEAADLIGVSKEVVTTWMRVLVERNLVEVESESHPNPTMRPTKEIIEKFKAYQMRQQDSETSDLMGEAEAAAPAEQDGAPKQPEAADTPQKPRVQEEPAAEDAAGEDELEMGVTYLIHDPKAERSRGMFIKDIRKGAKGLYISRSNPAIVRKKYYLGDSKVVWLTNVQTDKDMDSISGLQEMSILVSKFIDENEKAIILLEGLEYLISNNNFPVVLRLVQQLRDKVSTSEAKMLVPINPEALEDRQLPLLENECQVVR